MIRVLPAALALACVCSPAMAASADQPSLFAHALLALALGSIMLGAVFAGLRLNWFRKLAPAALIAVGLGACNPADLSAVGGLSPNQPPSAVVSEVLATAGVSAAGQAKVNAQIATVQKAALALCNIKPLAAGILNIGIALSPSLSTVAGSTVAQRVNGVASIACNALASAPVYSGMGGRQLVRGTAVLPNGAEVTIYGERM